MSSSSNPELQWCHFFHYSLLSIWSPNFLQQISESIQATYKLIAHVAMCVCVCRCLAQVTFRMHCPFVQICSCNRTRAFSLIHTDVVNSDVKTAASQHLSLLFSLKKMCISLEMSWGRWKCGRRGGQIKFNLTKAHALIGTQIRIAASYFQ